MGVQARQERREGVLEPCNNRKRLWGPEKEVEAKETAASPPVATSLGFIVQKSKTQHVILILYFFSWAPFVCRGNVHSALWKVYKLKMGTAQWCVVREWFTMPWNTTMMGHLRFFGLNACLSTCSTLILVLAHGIEKYAFQIFWSCVCLHKKWADLQHVFWQILAENPNWKKWYFWRFGLSWFDVELQPTDNSPYILYSTEETHLYDVIFLPDLGRPKQTLEKVHLTVLQSSR